MDQPPKQNRLTYLCGECGQMNIVTSTRGRYPEYCNGACRQRAHRRRQAARAPDLRPGAEARAVMEVIVPTPGEELPFPVYFL